MGVFWTKKLNLINGIAKPLILGLEVGGGGFDGRNLASARGYGIVGIKKAIKIKWANNLISFKGEVAFCFFYLE